MRGVAVTKSSSPVRLQEALIRSSTADRILGIVEPGRLIPQLDSESLLDVAAGLARHKVEPVVALPVDPTAVFAALSFRGPCRSLVGSSASTPMALVPSAVSN